ncbi:MAG: HPF/RaiA family ribosome-associated protein [Bacteroidia bacterium]
MTISIQTPSFAPKKELTMFVHEKANHLLHLYNDIISTEVCLKLDNSETRENKFCSIRLLIPGNDLLASAQCKTFEEAIAQTVNALEKQIKKRKTKIIAKRNKIQEVNTEISL